MFLLAHPDDEFGCFESIRRIVGTGRRVAIVYLTDGGSDPAMVSRRMTESRQVLARLGVCADDLHFIGALARFPDGGLHRHLKAAWLACQSFCDAHGPFDAIYVPAWEGGHPDHDATHALAVLLARKQGIPDVFQFSLYNANAVPKPFFRVLSPLAENGERIRLPIPWRARFHYLRLCLSYPSQWKTWVGLLPFVAPKLLIGGNYCLQRTNMARLEQRPHGGALLYESRGWLTWPAFESELRHFLDSVSV
ncbi:PIG-L deacetylase family protein [Cupriavidus agavae]|uniref:PIG-L deacetylase family protein n=1 Tax=Cupriavidus agavae TaxID=1001822 RepID=UPI001F3FDCA0|nr:PIG-L family deacetylase [Cupriavidus agavae]